MPKLNASSAAPYVFGALVGYVLSIGPMMRLAERYYWPDTFETIYAPVGLLMNVPGFGKAMNWYLMFWEPHEKSDMSSTTPAATEKPAPPAKP